jgi:hypothetical protein
MELDKRWPRECELYDLPFCSDSRKFTASRRGRFPVFRGCPKVKVRGRNLLLTATSAVAVRRSRQYIEWGGRFPGV